MRNPVMVDIKNFLDPDTVKAAGFTYLPIGRGVLPEREALQKNEGSSS